MVEDVTVLKAAAPCTLQELRHLAREPLRQAGAERAVVFGSWARGTADGYSDLDLVVVLPSHLPFVERGREVSRLLDVLPVPVDLLVYTPEEFERGRSRGVGVFASIAREGVDLL